MMITVSFYEAMVFVVSLLSVAFLLGTHQTRIIALERTAKEDKKEKDALLRMLSHIDQRLSRIEGMLNRD